ncbi:MAG: hypothetical protein F9K16_12915, partial [Thermoanaerobaculia bacterium]
MRRRSLLAPLLLAAGALAGRAALADTVALLPVRQGVRVEGLGARFEQAVTAELARRATVIDAERTRAFYVDTLGLRPDQSARFEFWAGETCFAIWEPASLG